MRLQDLSEYFGKMREISQKRGEISSRVRFMLRDVIDLRQGKWIPRRSDSNPKTMDQIQKDAEKETLDQQILLNSTPQAPRQQDDRVSSRKNSESCSLITKLLILVLAICSKLFHRSTCTDTCSVID